MNKTDVSFKNVLAICVENNVDFEVWHGKTTHKSPMIRRQMLIAKPGTPTIFVTFGDVKHGELISVLTVSSNNKLNVTLSEFMEHISTPAEVRPWSASELSSEIIAEGNLQLVDKNTRTVHVAGKIVNEIEHDDAGYTYNFDLERIYLLASGEQHVSVTSLTLKTPVELQTGESVNATGVYSYPSTVTI